MGDFVYGYITITNKRQSNKEVNLFLLLLLDINYPPNYIPSIISSFKIIKVNEWLYIYQAGHTDFDDKVKIIDKNIFNKGTEIFNHHVFENIKNPI